MVMLEVVFEVPGVTETGENVTVEPEGNPLAVSVTASVKSPFTEATVTW